jgi:hypothetical protein
MITFRQHLEISKYSKKDNGMFEYISRLSPEDKVRYTREINNVYPLSMKGSASDSIKSKFNVTTNVMNLVLGQFIMLEQIITGKTKYATNEENDLAIAKLLIRPKHHKEFDNENAEDEAINTEGILELPVQEVYNVLAEFLDNRDFVLFKQFSGVFYEIADKQDGEEEDDADPTAEQLFSQQWYWYSMVRRLAKEDITMYSKIYMLKMETVMPEMSYLAQKNKIESANQRQQEMMRKL